ncbi:MAG: LacI family DNA-binding transcriptional regulator, partial [Dermatophilaceae bacterium]
PTLSDVAKETGLSTAAVSYALRGLQVPEETQARVRDAADRLGYEVNPIARALASGRTDTIGVLCGSLGDSWQQGVTTALVNALPAVGRTAIIVDAASDPAAEIDNARRLIQQRVDALIVMPLDPAAPEWPELARAVPIIAVGDGLPGASTAAEIVYDNVFGVTDGLTRLAEIGHTRVAVLSPLAADTPDRPAETVAHRVSARLGLSTELLTTPHDLDEAAAVVTDRLRRKDPPTAFFCLADSMAWGVYAAAKELSLEIPTDLSVIGYDDKPVSRLLTPALSTYSWPMEDLIDAIVSRVVRSIESGGRSRRKVITPTPVLRGSVGAPRR